MVNVSTTNTDNGDTTAADDVGTAQLSCQDVLLELYWYLKHKRSARRRMRTKNEQAFDNTADTDVNVATTTVAPPPQQRVLMTVDDIVWSLQQEGILFWRDPRFVESQKIALGWVLPHGERQQKQQHQESAGKIKISFPLFTQLVTPCARLFLNAFNEQFVIPDWSSFVSDLQYFFDKSTDHTDGQTAQYIPLLRDADPHRWGVAVCSVDGQRVSMGDASTARFSLQSVSKPVTYAIALTTEGDAFMEDWVDVEPAGRPFNTQDLDPITHRPFNASINSGAIMSAGVVASGFRPKRPGGRLLIRSVKLGKICVGVMIPILASQTKHTNPKKPQRTITSRSHII